MQFLFIRSQVSHSLPSDPASQQRPWPLVIVLSFYDLILTIRDFNPIYIERMLGTHKAGYDNSVTAAPLLRAYP